MATPKSDPTTITVIVEDHTAVRQTANIVIRRGNKGAMRQAHFTNAQQLAEAIVDLSRDLSGQEIDAAPAKKAPPAKRPSSKPGKTPAKPRYESIDDAPAPRSRESDADTA